MTDEAKGGRREREKEEGRSRVSSREKGKEAELEIEGTHEAADQVPRMMKIFIC